MHSCGNGPSPRMAPAHICFVPKTPTLFREKHRLVLCHNTGAFLEGSSIPTYYLCCVIMRMKYIGLNYI